MTSHSLFCSEWPVRWNKSLLIFLAGNLKWTTLAGWEISFVNIINRIAVNTIVGTLPKILVRIGPCWFVDKHGPFREHYHPANTCPISISLSGHFICTCHLRGQQLWLIFRIYQSPSGGVSLCFYITHVVFKTRKILIHVWYQPYESCVMPTFSALILFHICTLLLVCFLGKTSLYLHISYCFPSPNFPFILF